MDASDGTDGTDGTAAVCADAVMPTLAALKAQDGFRVCFCEPGADVPGASEGDAQLELATFQTADDYGVWEGRAPSPVSRLTLSRTDEQQAFEIFKRWLNGGDHYEGFFELDTIPDQYMKNNFLLLVTTSRRPPLELSAHIAVGIVEASQRTRGWAEPQRVLLL